MLLKKLFGKLAPAPTAHAPPPVDFPTAATIADWDDASLFAAAGYYASTRVGIQGMDALNEAERNLCCLFDLVNQVSNGGFGQWLDLRPDEIGHTAAACEAIGAASTAMLINEVLKPLRHPLSFETQDAWLDYLESLPREEHLRLDGYSTAFLSIEADLLRCVYRYARQHWAEVRTK